MAQPSETVRLQQLVPMAFEAHPLNSANRNQERATEEFPSQELLDVDKGRFSNVGW
jgi:hypothetical protein